MQKKIAISLPRAICARLARKKQAILMSTFLFAGASVILFADIALLPHKRWFFSAFLTRFGLGPLLSMYRLMPEPQALPIQPGGILIFHLMTTQKEIALFIGTFLILFSLYFMAIRYLPDSLSYRFIWRSTLLLGLLYIFIPIVTSQDIFSYIAYARIGMFYHLNPLITSPKIISHDPIYHFIYWVNQPSIYGPTWIYITYLLQWLALTLGFKSILAMEVLFRLFGLAVYLASVHLVWLLSARVQGSEKTTIPDLVQVRRLRATLAFAWNPFLLFEASVNAHNDISILFLVLAGLWFFFPQRGEKRYSYLLTAILLALATSLKVTVVILLPGFLLVLWKQHTPRDWRGLRAPALMASLYAGLVLLLYLPFWQHGALLHTFQNNPGTSRDINSLYELLVIIYAHLRKTPLIYTMDHGSSIEVLTHLISIFLFAIIYGALCLRALFVPHSMKTLTALARWIALIWLLYCLVGSPWFWPWYTITFFGPIALVEAANRKEGQEQGLWSNMYLSLFVRVLTLSMLSFYAFSNLKSDAPPFPVLPRLRWMYLRGIWLWLPPLLVLCIAPALTFLRKWKRKKAT